jgi:hypothetical protein
MLKPWNGNAASEEKEVRQTGMELFTRNPHLNMHIRTGMDNLFERADDFVTAHQIRLITSVFMPKVSYTYIAIVDFIKGGARELTGLAEKL